MTTTDSFRYTLEFCSNFLGFDLRPPEKFLLPGGNHIIAYWSGLPNVGRQLRLDIYIEPSYPIPVSFMTDTPGWSYLSQLNFEEGKNLVKLAGRNEMYLMTSPDDMAEKFLIERFKLNLKDDDWIEPSDIGIYPDRVVAEWYLQDHEDIDDHEMKITVWFDEDKKLECVRKYIPDTHIISLKEALSRIVY